MRFHIYSYDDGIVLNENEELVAACFCTVGDKPIVERIKDRDDRAVLLAAAPELLETLEKVTDTAETINNLQHAGIMIDGEVWSLLYARTNKARAVIEILNPAKAAIAKARGGIDRMKHTPGPWRIGDRGQTVFGPPNGNPVPEIIASVNRRGNAHLLAAAPELLEASKAVEEAYGCECLDGEATGHCPMCILRAVISRIEGGG